MLLLKVFMMKRGNSNLSETMIMGSLIGKYITGKESKYESDNLQVWLKKNPNNRKRFNHLNDEKEIASAIEDFDRYDKEIAWQKYLNRVATLSLKRVLFRWKVAAVLFFIVGSVGILSLLNDEWPGNQETLQLYTTVSTSKGQNSKIVLPDSTVVWINSETTLSYNNNFAAVNRQVELVGQAYFQVAKNEEMPLVVTCNDLKVKVLGTKFDVSAYSLDNYINVVLESGSIELLHARDQSFDYILNPGEMAEFDTEQQQLIVHRTDVYKHTSWKDGILIFKNDPMKEVFEKLERWYNIDIEIQNEQVYKLIFNATIVNESVEEIFNLIKYTCAINYKIIPSDKPQVPIKVIISD